METHAQKLAMLPAAFLARSLRKEFVRFIENAGDGDELELWRIISDYFAAFNSHATKCMVAYFSPDTRINPVIFEGANLTLARYLRFLDKGIDGYSACTSTMCGLSSARRKGRRLPYMGRWAFSKRQLEDQDFGNVHLSFPAPQRRLAGGVTRRERVVTSP